MKFPNASGTYLYTALDCDNNPLQVSVFVYRSSYMGGSETTVSVENAIHPIVIRNSYDGNFCGQFDNGTPGTVFIQRTRNAAIQRAIEFLALSVSK